MSRYLFPYFILLNYVQRKEHNVCKHRYDVALYKNKLLLLFLLLVLEFTLDGAMVFPILLVLKFPMFLCNINNGLP